jgi:Spo0E like sporulation regulatory protein
MISMQEHDLLQEIQRLKSKLTETDYNLDNLSHPDIVRISQDLDELIVCYQTQKNLKSI